MKKYDDSVLLLYCLIHFCSYKKMVFEKFKDRETVVKDAWNKLMGYVLISFTEGKGTEK